MFTYISSDEVEWIKLKGKKCRCSKGKHLVRMCPSMKYVCMEYCLAPTKKDLKFKGPLSKQYQLGTQTVDWQ